MPGAITSHDVRDVLLAVMADLNGFAQRATTVKNQRGTIGADGDVQYTSNPHEAFAAIAVNDLVVHVEADHDAQVIMIAVGVVDAVTASRLVDTGRQVGATIDMVDLRFVSLFSAAVIVDGGVWCDHRALAKVNQVRRYGYRTYMSSRVMTPLSAER